MRPFSHFAFCVHLRTAAMRLAITSFLLSGACSTAPSNRASDDVLRSPIFVKIADRVFRTRLVEVQLVSKRGEASNTSYNPQDEDTGKIDAEKLARDASRSSAPVSAGLLQIVPTVLYEGRPPNIDCVSWRCRSAKAGVANDLPASFMLVDQHDLRQLEAYYNGDKNVFELLSAVEPFNDKPKVACPKQDTTPSGSDVKVPLIITSCYAVVRLSPQVLAVWPLDPRRRENAEATAARQAQALALVSKTE